MNLSNNQVELTTADAKPNKPAGLGFGLHSEGNIDKPICLSASSTPVPSTNIFGSPQVFGYAGDFQWSPFSTLMAGYERRLHSFKRWPKQMAQCPIDMVRSEFYYSGSGDVVTCFFCGITLKEWDSVDNIDFEHKKFSPQCKYLMMARDI